MNRAEIVAELRDLAASIYTSGPVAAHIGAVADRIEGMRRLPTEFGALILAHLNASTAPRLLTLGQHDEQPAWFCSGFMSAGPVYVTEIGLNWVQIDPDTLLPLEES